MHIELVASRIIVQSTTIQVLEIPTRVMSYHPSVLVLTNLVGPPTVESMELKQTFLSHDDMPSVGTVNND